MSQSRSLREPRSGARPPRNHPDRSHRGQLTARARKRRNQARRRRDLEVAAAELGCTPVELESLQFHDAQQQVAEHQARMAKSLKDQSRSYGRRWSDWY